MKKTWKLSEINALIDPEKEITVADNEYVYIMEKKTERLKMAFIKADTQRETYRQIDLETVIGFIAEKLKDKIDVERFLKELLLLHSHPHEIVELKERLQKAPAITPVEGCYSLMIGGKRGRPYEFNIVGS